MKNYLVIGLGIFGDNLATSLFRSGQDVMVIDKNQGKINRIIDQVSVAYCGDATDELFLNGVSLESVDIAIVTIGEDERSSLLVTHYLLEAKVPYVLAKANSFRHGSILHRLGVHQIIYPEISSADNLCQLLVMENITRLISISSEQVVAIYQCPGEMIGQKIKHIQKKLDSSDLFFAGIQRSQFHVSNEAISKMEHIFISIHESETVILEKDQLVLLGNKRELELQLLKSAEENTNSLNRAE